MFQTFKNLYSVYKIAGYLNENPSVIFYSEGKNYWVHLEGLLGEFLNISDVKVCFLSSASDDPGLELKHKQLTCFKIDEGPGRTWLFANIQTKLFVMTMPDLQNFQIKRSKHPVHYVYLQHSLVSLHMIYRPAAFDHFDSIFCAGPHHNREIRATEKVYGLPAKNLVNHGYARLDSIMQSAQQHSSKTRSTDSPIEVLIAPSWGPDCIIETMGSPLVGILLEGGFKVTLRPHPQTIKFSKSIMQEIEKQYSNNPLFKLEKGVAGQDSLHSSKIMISDWSGAALDYSFGLEKPVLFIDVPKKINNPEYEKINIPPLEESIRAKIGRVLAVENLKEINNLIKSMLANHTGSQATTSLRSETVYNPGNCSTYGAKALLSILNGLE